jgi:hypothetical protein
MIFFFLASSGSSISRFFAGAASLPSSSPRTRAPRRVGNTRVFQKRKFSGVSFCEGGFPRFTAMEELDEELDMITDGERLGCGFRVLVFLDRYWRRLGHGRGRL